MEAQLRRLVPPGGLFDNQFPVVEATTRDAVRAAFAWKKQTGGKLTLLGSARSFGHQFHPSSGGTLLDVSRLERRAEIVEELSDGTVWVRAGGGVRFVDLLEFFPRYRTLFPPTSDSVTLSGALAACTHNTSGYFADEVRAFRVLTPNGDEHLCSADAPALAGDLFRVVPGSFGALGVTTDVEIRLHPVAPEQLFGVHSVYAGPSEGGRYLDVLEETRDSSRFAEGAGAVVYGNRGHAIVFGDAMLPLGHQPDKNQALLTDEAIEEHAFTQGLANRFPRIAEATVKKTYPHGIMRWAPWYGFHFYQRGFDRSFEVLGRSGLKYGLARALGVDRRLPVYHQSWFYPRRELRNFVDLYFKVLDRFPGIEKRVEQQDLVLLPPCRYPAHSIGETTEPVGVLTSSYSVATLKETEKERIATFFREVSKEGFERLGARVSLCKQVHCEGSVLRRMHAPFASRVGELKARVDPEGVLTSKHLDLLLTRGDEV